MKFNEAMVWTMGLVLTCGALLPVFLGRLVYVWVKQIKNS